MIAVNWLGWVAITAFVVCAAAYVVVDMTWPGFNKRASRTHEIATYVMLIAFVAVFAFGATWLVSK